MFHGLSVLMVQGYLKVGEPSGTLEKCRDYKGDRGG